MRGIAGANNTAIRTWIGEARTTTTPGPVALPNDHLLLGERRVGSLDSISRLLRPWSRGDDDDLDIDLSPDQIQYAVRVACRQAVESLRTWQGRR